MAKLADAPDLGSGVERRASSSLALGTNILLKADKSRLSIATDQLFSFLANVTFSDIYDRTLPMRD